MADNKVSVTNTSMDDKSVSEIKTTNYLDTSEVKSELKKKKNKKTTPDTKVEKSIDIENSKNIDEEVVEELEKRKKKLLKKPEKISEDDKNRKDAEIFSKATRYNTSIEVGLTHEQVEQRRKEGFVNITSKSGTKSYWKIIYTNVCTFFNLILLIIFVALMSVKKYSDCFFMVIAVANTIIGVIQEVKAKKTIDKLKLVTAPVSKVIRDGEEMTVNAKDVCLDDIMILKSGYQIAADATLLQGAIEVNESLLTGESLPIKKVVGDTVLAGSFVVSGTAIVRVDKIGRFCYANTLQQKAKRYTKPKSELVKSLNLIIKVITFALIPIGAALFTFNYLGSAQEIIWGTEGRVADAIASTAGSLIGMIPAGLILLTSVALAAGVIRLSNSKTLVQELYCIEMLARTNCLCLDKTGTLTDGTMNVNEVVVFNNETDLDNIMGSYLATFKDSNQTSIALSNFFPLSTKYRAIASIPFSSSRKYSAVSFDKKGTYLLGAPEYLYKGNDTETKNFIAGKVKNGFRVMMLCQSDSYIKDEAFQGSARPVAIFVLVDHIRKEAPDTIKWFNENNVQVKIISGDNQYTVSNIAKACGVIDADKCVSLEGISIQETKALASQYTVFGRVSPEQKAALVQAFKTEGKTVAMTGDGVNDILAMKQADCSIAMASGADAAKNVSHLVLLDSNFASMPKVVEEGRRVINNINRSSSLFLMKTIFTICLTLSVIILNICQLKVVYPLQPRNLMLLELFGIGLPSFFLALQPNKNLIKGSFLKNTVMRALPGAISMLLGIVIVLILYNVNVFKTESIKSFNDTYITTLLVVGLLSVSVAMMYTLCVPFNLYRGILIITMTVAMLICFFVLPDTITGISYKSLDNVGWLAMFILVFALPLVTIALDRFFALFRDDVDKSKALGEREHKNVFAQLGINFKKKGKNTPQPELAGTANSDSSQSASSNKEEVLDVDEEEEEEVVEEKPVTSKPKKSSTSKTKVTTVETKESLSSSLTSTTTKKPRSKKTTQK